MAEINVLDDQNALAEFAVIQTVEALKANIEAKQSVSWALSGGSAPLQAYKLIAKSHKKDVDWGKVWYLLGDERCVPLDDPQSNWSQIEKTLLAKLPVDSTKKIRPTYELGPEKAAENYELSLKLLLHNMEGVPRIDVLWLGLGEDGHTLSLFPRSKQLEEDIDLVAAVYDSPKPPTDRISLTLKCLKNVNQCFILAPGKNKAGIVPQAVNGDSSLPIVKAIEAIEKTSGKVTWLLDKDSASKL